MRIGTAEDVAAMLKVRRETVYALAQDEKIPTLRRIGPRLRFDLDAVERWMQEPERG